MRLAVVLFVLAACQSGKDSAKGSPKGAPAEPGSGSAKAAAPPAEITPEYRQDITNLCDAVKLSGADQQPEEARQMIVAKWLGDNIQSQAGHDFLVHIQPLDGAAKADALDAEAKRVGLAGCALAALWKK